MSEATTIEAAQKRLARAALAQQMNPAGAGISGYVNSLMLRAKLDALTECYINPPNATWTLKDYLEAATLRHLNQKAQELEDQALRMSLAQGTPEGQQIALS